MARQLCERQPDCRFLIVGGDPFGVQDDYEARLLALGSQPELADRVHWTGQLADVRPALAAMDPVRASRSPRTLRPGQHRSYGHGQTRRCFRPRRHSGNRTA